MCDHGLLCSNIGRINLKSSLIWNEYIYLYICIINFVFVCSVLEHQLNTAFTAFLMLFQCHHKNAQFYIVSVLLNIIFKHNLNKLFKLFGIFFVQCQGYENHCKVVKGVWKLFVLFWALWRGYQNFLKDHVGLPKLSARCFRGSKTFLTPQKSLPP